MAKRLTRWQRFRIVWMLRRARLRCAWSGRHEWCDSYDPETAQCRHFCRACFTQSGVTTAGQRYDAVFLHGLGVKP